jgi:cytochrome P450
MTATLSHGLPVGFELANATTWREPWPMYRNLRDHDPVHHVVPPGSPEEPKDYYVLSRHADIWAAARDHQTFSSAQGLTVNYGELDMIGLADNPPMVMQDPPVHTEFRKLVARGFTPRQVEAVEPKVREYVIERVERLRADGGGDIVAELFDGRRPLPRGPRGGSRAIRRVDRCDRRRQHQRERHRRGARHAR